MRIFEEITGNEFKQWRIEHGISVKTLAMFFRVTSATIYNIEKEEGVIGEVYRLALVGLMKEVEEKNQTQRG